ncbi:sugar phosphate isomerase/epimerase [candidate division KSB1 bacterium]|nr:sugar phosphate isomerase/epimerase [candidate division KSB1 bacterium]
MPRHFKLGLNIDNVAEKPPLELAPGWETAEIPIAELLIPKQSDADWEKQLAEIRTWNQPRFVATSHWLWDQQVTGEFAADWSDLERQAQTICRRMAQLADGMVAGVWGNFFPVSDEKSRTKETDKTLRYCEMVSKYAQKFGVLVALEPTANPHTVFPTYKDGIEFVKKLNLPSIRLMADLNYFVEIDEPFEDIQIDPDLCLHVHIQGEKYQPNVGNCTEKILHIFRVLRDMGYERTVSSAHPWTITEGKTFDYRLESAKTLRYLKHLREQVFSE